MMSALGGGAEKSQAPPESRLKEAAGAVVMMNPPVRMAACPPTKKPAEFCRTIRPLALRLPRICEGLPLLILFHATELAEGWTNVVVSPTPMLKLPQLIIVLPPV